MTSMRMSAKSKFMSGHPRDFLDGGDAEPDLLQPVVLQEAHALLDRLLRDHVGRHAVDRHLADLVGHRHDLVEADAALVARVPAARAADRLERLDVESGVEEAGALEAVDLQHGALLAVGAEAARET